MQSIESLNINGVLPCRRLSSSSLPFPFFCPYWQSLAATAKSIAYTRYYCRIYNQQQKKNYIVEILSSSSHFHDNIVYLSVAIAQNVSSVGKSEGGRQTTLLPMGQTVSFIPYPYPYPHTHPFHSPAQTNIQHPKVVLRLYNGVSHKICLNSEKDFRK